MNSDRRRPDPSSQNGCGGAPSPVNDAATAGGGATRYPRIRRLTTQDIQAIVDGVNVEWRRQSAYEQAMQRFMIAVVEAKWRSCDAQADFDDEKSGVSR